MKKTRTAVIGVGNMGQHHARVYSEISNLVAVADIDQKQGKEIAARYDAKYYKDYQELLKAENIDAVSVAVPTPQHKKVAIDCLSMGTPTLVEKPLSGSPREAREILACAEENDCCLMVGHIERFNPAVLELDKIVKEGGLGEIVNLLAVRVGISPPKGKNLDVATDLAIHDVDIFNQLLRDYPKRTRVVRNQVLKDNIADSALVLLEYDKATGMVQTNWITPIRIRKLYVTGTKGFAELDYIEQDLVVHSEIFKREIHIEKQEPLKLELEYFLKKAHLGIISEDVEDAIKAIEILT